MADREREVVSASLSRLLRTLSSASMSRRRCPLALLQPLPVRQSEMTSVESAERCCSSCSEDSNNNGRSKSEERETEAEQEAGEGGGEEACTICRYPSGILNIQRIYNSLFTSNSCTSFISVTIIIQLRNSDSGDFIFCVNKNTHVVRCQNMANGNF